ncbi:MAG: type IX secretion system membrane protein PorP/SprF [Flavobacteriales bacterium]|nr:type IX secretion system membrane protein PorP/SprF [Flavobacteriales bacterium]
MKNQVLTPFKSLLMKKLLAFSMLLSISAFAIGQQELMISQYMFNGLVLNPAYAGTHPYWSTSVLHRSQWVNFDKAPVTQTLCIDGPIAKRKLGLGFTLSNDKIGITRQMEAGANLSYKLFLGSGNLSFGLRASVASYNADLTDAKIWDAGDPVYQNNIQGEMIPKVGFGAYYYTTKWYAGFSVPVVYAADQNIIPDNSDLNRYFTNHMYLHAGYVFEPSLTLAVKPSVLVKYEAGAPVEVDINCNLMFFQKYWLGVGYRTGDALVAMAEWNITPQFRLGYAYDYTLTDIADYSSGSHEVMLGFDFGKDVSLKTRSPRYF